jgi:hypothetical protein
LCRFFYFSIHFSIQPSAFRIRVMPSPLGHAIAGVAAGWLVVGAPTRLRQPKRLKEVALFAGLGMLPDLDLVFGIHSGPTHSIGASVAIGVVTFAVATVQSLPRRGRLALACVAAYTSHVLLDWLGTDASPPLGIMAFWPFSRDYFESDLHIFMAISRRYYQGWRFVEQNLRAIAWELVVLLPILGAIAGARRRASSASAGIALVLLVSTGPTVDARQGAPVQATLPPAPADLDPYDELLLRYRSGAPDEATDRLGRLISTEAGREYFRDWIDKARRDKRRPQLEAAMLVLSEGVIKIWKPDDPFPERLLPLYSGLIRRVHGALRDIDRQAPFLRAWYLLWESFRQLQLDRPLPVDLDYINAAVADFPRDAQILLAAGSRHELIWWNSRDNTRLTLTGQPAPVVRQLTLARDLFRRSLATDPNETEARLRLTRVLLELNDLKPAAEAIAAHDWTNEIPLAKYLAAMLEGDLHERKDEFAAAAAAYERASKLAEHPQAALVARAYVEHLQGHRADAARTIVQSLSDHSSTSDPWWPFIYGQAWRYQAYLEDARSMVMK